MYNNTIYRPATIEYMIVKRTQQLSHYAETTHTDSLRARPGKPIFALSGTQTAGSELHRAHKQHTVYHPTSTDSFGSGGEGQLPGAQLEP